MTTTGFQPYTSTEICHARLRVAALRGMVNATVAFLAVMVVVTIGLLSYSKATGHTPSTLYSVVAAAMLLACLASVILGVRLDRVKRPFEELRYEEVLELELLRGLVPEANAFVGSVRFLQGRPLKRGEFDAVIAVHGHALNELVAKLAPAATQPAPDRGEPHGE